MTRHAAALLPEARNTPPGRNYAAMAAIAEEVIETGDLAGTLERALTMLRREGQRSSRQTWIDPPHRRIPIPSTGGRPVPAGNMSRRGDRAATGLARRLGLDEDEARALRKVLK